MNRRLDQELVGRGLARSRTQAGKLIGEGAVSINGVVATKASHPVAPEAGLTVAGTPTSHYVSRAALKLISALEAFPLVDPSGARCLDAGASTGGFTQVLLEAGAREVLAVDVGHGQLVDQLRRDPRVQVHEGYNVRELSVDSLGGAVDLVVADLSFISLTLVLRPFAAVCVPGAQLLLMVKPQFEVGRESLAHTGVVSSEVMRRKAVTSVAVAAVEAALSLRGLAASALPGQDGNLEYFLWLGAAGEDSPDPDQTGQQSAEEFVDRYWPRRSEG
ncbi:TlyA family RNA methyltransferase [Psychromicrobium xiongbiense]|uniref:TlyA family RNA methyltransferase n=1 Tax=Psychromicrobium xiongbiense TaxID=3051184 RepID=UPI0025550CE7|nr:TlyA family RNA methyltransferase [Psychromicrobium sp. YIM S02556]